MSKHWAIIIGANQYQHLQPLLYAQRDAQNLWNFLVQEAKIPPNQCILLTDISPAFDEFSTVPSREMIQIWVERLCKTDLQPGDFLWVFFCGYGTQLEHHDYLMPIEGDPDRVAETGVSLQWLLEQLQQAPTRNMLLLLDMNRSQGSLPGHLIGAETIELATRLDVPTILSCKPEQFSHETLALRSGLFTQALLEGLRYQGCVTPIQLADYLRDRIPELSEHHWRPDQDPVAVIPAAYKHLLILPGISATAIPIQMQEKVAVGTGLLTAAAQPDTSPPSQDPASNGSSITGASSALVPVLQPVTSAGTLDNGFWKNLLIGGAILVFAMLAGIFAQTPSLVTGDSEPGEETIVPDATEFNNSEGSRGLEGGGSGPSPESGTPSTASPAPTGPETNRSDQQPSPSPGAGKDNASGGGGGFSIPLISDLLSSNGDPTSETDSESNRMNARNRDRLQQARTDLEAGRYTDAEQVLGQIPLNQRDSEFEALQQELQTQMQRILQADQRILEDAKASIRENQASSFNRAIESARRVPTGHPLHEEAQQNINRWSYVILNLAEGRAAQGNLDSAIAAAQLVPGDQGEVSRQAQQRITQWQQQKTNQALIAQANTLLQPGQAHTFEKAILMVRQIPPDQPGYDTAQRLADQWSREMMSIARARAAQSLYDSAIRAARLVPKDTVAYPQAQDEIKRWQAQRVDSP